MATTLSKRSSLFDTKPPPPPIASQTLFLSPAYLADIVKQR